jgi:hypothetical protein
MIRKATKKAAFFVKTHSVKMRNAKRKKIGILQKLESENNFENGNKIIVKIAEFENRKIIVFKQEALQIANRKNLKKWTAERIVRVRFKINGPAMLKNRNKGDPLRLVWRSRKMMEKFAKEAKPINKVFWRMFRMMNEVEK